MLDDDTVDLKDVVTNFWPEKHIAGRLTKRPCRDTICRLPYNGFLFFSPFLFSCYIIVFLFLRVQSNLDITNTDIMSYLI